MTDDDVLPMWTIYILKEGGYVAVLWDIDSNEKGPVPAGVGLKCENLQPLREMLASRGLIPVNREESDDPTIVETWM